jgi:hypothetical protein
MSGWLAEYERGSIRECPARCLDEECGATWLVEGHEEYGCFFLESENDMLCPDCGREGEFE